MSNVDWVSLVSVITSWTLVLVIFLGRNWLKARIEKGVQYKFDKGIENLRTELRKNEESFKTDLRNKETEITLLRNAVLSGSASRQSLLDRRRFDAVEKVWTAVNDLAQLKGLSAMMAIVNFKEVAKEAGHPKMQQFLAFIGTGVPLFPFEEVPQSL
jgi:hypothetical protein